MNIYVHLPMYYESTELNVGYSEESKMLHNCMYNYYLIVNKYIKHIYFDQSKTYILDSDSIAVF